MSSGSVRWGSVRAGRVFATLALGVALLCAPVPSKAAEVQFPRGSVIGLIPPDGMVESTQFSGFEDEKRKASILIVDLPPEAFPQIEEGFTDEALASKGIKVLSREPFDIKGAKAFLVTGTQTAGPLTVRKWILLVGTDTLTSLVTVQAVDNSESQLTDQDVKDTLASLTFRSPQDQVAALPFALNDLAGFRVIRTLAGNTAILTDGPKNVIKGAEQPYMIITVAPGAPREDDRRQFAIRAMASLNGLRDIKLERAEPLRIGQVSGFEVMATAVDVKTGEPVKVVQWMRFGQTGHVRMVAITKADAFPDLYPRLRAIRDGVDGR